MVRRATVSVPHVLLCIANETRRGGRPLGPEVWVFFSLFSGPPVPSGIGTLPPQWEKGMNGVRESRSRWVGGEELKHPSAKIWEGTHCWVAHSLSHSSRANVPGLPTSSSFFSGPIPKEERGRRTNKGASQKDGPAGGSLSHRKRKYSQDRLRGIYQG